MKNASTALVPYLITICAGFLRLNYVLMFWRNSRIVFIPQTCEGVPPFSKDYGPISLTSFCLGMFEKILDSYIRDKLLLANISKAQETYVGLEIFP